MLPKAIMSFTPLPATSVSSVSSVHARADVIRISASRGISMAGAEAGYIALLALAWHLTGSPSNASLVLLAAIVARTAGAPLVGWVGDHLDRRMVAVVSELAAALAFGSLALAQSITHLLMAMVIGTFAAACGGAALDAALPNLVPEHDLARANATLGMARTTGHMVGPVLGGLLVAAVGARSAFLLDGASSVIAAACLLGVRGSVGGSAARAGQRFGSGMLVGLRYIAGDRALRRLGVGWAGMCVCFAFVSAAELPLAVHFGADEAGLGAIVTTWCAGALLGSWLARRIGEGALGARTLARNALICAGVFGAVGVMPWFAGVLTLMFIGGCSMSIADVAEATMLQTRIEDDVRARVMAAFGGLMSAVFGLSLALAASVVELTSPETAYLCGGAWCVVAAAGFVLLARELARERQLPPNASHEAERQPRLMPDEQAPANAVASEPDTAKRGALA